MPSQNAAFPAAPFFAILFDKSGQRITGRSIILDVTNSTPDCYVRGKKPTTPTDKGHGKCFICTCMYMYLQGIPFGRRSPSKKQAEFLNTSHAKDPLAQRHQDLLTDCLPARWDLFFLPPPPRRQFLLIINLIVESQTYFVLPDILHSLSCCSPSSFPSIGIAVVEPFFLHPRFSSPPVPIFPHPNPAACLSWLITV